MGEDLEIIDVDVRQRKSGKNKNQHDDVVISGSDGGHGSSKRRRRGRGGDRSEGIKVIPEEEVLSEPKEKKGKVVINKKTESDDEDGDDADDAYDSSLEDEESSGSWLLKLIIIAIIVSLGFSLIWLNDGSSTTNLDGIDSDVEPLNDIVDSYIPEKVDNEEETVRSDIELDIDDTNYEVYQDHQQWSQEYSDSSSSGPEIIAEVSESIGEPSSELNVETKYQESRDEGYFDAEPVNGQQESVETGTWMNGQDNQPLNQEEELLTSFQKPESFNPSQQYDHNYNQQTWEHQDNQQLEESSQQETQQDPRIEQAQPYEYHNDEQLVQSSDRSFEMYPETSAVNDQAAVEERYYECQEGSYWDGLSCVNPESFVDDFNNGLEKQPETVEENNFYPEQQ